MRTRIAFPPGHTPDSIAQACGVHVVTIYKVFKGGICSGPLAILIHYATQGATPCWTLRPDLWTEGQIPPIPTGNASAA